MHSPREKTSVLTADHATASSRAAQDVTAQESERQFRDFLDCLEDSCFEVDLHGTYVHVNEALCRRVGLSADEIIGKNFRELSFTAADAAAQLREVFATVYRTGQPVKSFEYRTRIRENGTEAYNEISVSLRRDATGKPIGFVGISRDTTERKRQEHELAEAKLAAEEANRAKSEFLANMSHEIRTPMNGILGMTGLVLDTTLTPEQTESLSIVKASAESLLRILNDILDFSKIESRKLELESVSFALEDVLRHTLKPLALAANAKGVELVVDVAPGTASVLVGDPARLQQVLTNLVGNAIKFTERGRVTLAVRESSRSDGTITLHFRTTDTGIGIPPERQSSIFEAFCQAESSTTRRFGGTGLGLTISASLVQMMGGRIWVDSRPGAGATFHFTAVFGVAAASEVARRDERVPTAAAPMQSSREAPAERRASKAERVLLAEDNVINQRIAIAILRKRGHDVTVVSTGREALARLECECFDVVLMDVQMPDMDGFEATEAIRAREKGSGRRQRIIAMTAHAMVGDRERCLAAGMDDYVSKPVEPATLCAVVEDRANDSAAVTPLNILRHGT